MSKGLHFRLLLLLLSLLMAPVPHSPAVAMSEAVAADRSSLFLETSLDNTRPYVGQEILLTYTLFFSDIAPRISDLGEPGHAGLWVQELTPEGYIQSSPATVNGRSFRRAVVKQLRIVPMQGGPLSVSGYHLRCLLPQNSGMSTENPKENETIIEAPNAFITARALPAPAPKTFSGAVGSFSVNVSPLEFRIHAGEPMTLLITVGGRGNLRSFPPVSVTLPDGFREERAGSPAVQKAPAGKTAPSVSSRLILIPEKTGTFRFSPVQMTMFDPWKEHYETVTSGEITVTVLPAIVNDKAKTAAATQMLPSGKSDIGEKAIMVIMAVAAVAIIAVMFILGGRKRKNGKRRSSGQLSSEQPHQSDLLSAESLRRRIYDALRQIGIPNPAGLTVSQLEKDLARCRVKPSGALATLELLKMIDRAIYTPGKTSDETLETLNRKTATVLDDIMNRSGS
jgi:hypothetical protein